MKESFYLTLEEARYLPKLLIQRFGGKSGDLYHGLLNLLQKNWKMTEYFDLIDSLKIDVSHERRGGYSNKGLQIKFTVPEDGDYYLIAK